MAAKVDVFAISKEGFDVHIQLESEHVYQDLLTLLARMQADGFTPRTRTESHQSPVEGRGDSQDVCPVHGKAKQGKGGLYCPTKLEDGSWCKWKQGKGAVA